MNNDLGLLRPRDLAVMLLASGDTLPRQRARDQQADRAGLDLKRRILHELLARDPEAAQLEAVLLSIVEAVGPPTGPTRALARAFLEDWQALAARPEATVYLLNQALRGPQPEEGRHGRQLPG